MIPESLSDPVAIAAVAVVTALVLVRSYAGGALVDVRFTTFWGRARALFMPPLDRIIKRVLGFKVENRAYESEHVADLTGEGTDPATVAATLQSVTDRRVEVSVLSGRKTDWDGNREVASLVAYAGDRPWPNAPEWLRNDQIHVFFFDTGEATRVAAHYEANSWRPDRWKDHLRKGETFDPERGVEAVTTWLQRAGYVTP